MPRLATEKTPRTRRKTAATKPVDVAAVSAELQGLQRKRSIVLKSRNMQEVRLQAVVAGTLGYCSGLSEGERAAKFKEARDLIQRVMDEEATGHQLVDIIRITLVGVNAFNEEMARLEKAMRVQARLLPAAAWVAAPEQRGFGLINFAKVVGECGDLALYANPAKVWRRMGCAPWEFDGKTQMGATWRSGKNGKLPAAEWEAFGYCPRRRSLAFLIGQGMVKQNYQAGRAALPDEEEQDEGVQPDRGGLGNGDQDRETEVVGAVPGPYRARYLSAKARLKELHPDYPDLRCHLHGMLLCTKLLLRQLWAVWNSKPEVPPPWEG